ncbi:hypothetical protein M405DRAFT_860399 [Rhizopogon salebrosus TDB-379]|nr:hypothetical protein M405DRAFT_860399 [Rhizopogon salebrosus TDB-379]
MFLTLAKDWTRLDFQTLDGVRASAVADEESLSASESEMMHAATDPSDFQRIPIKDLFNFSRAEDWLGSFFHTAIRGLDAEIELYELLDLDAEGIHDPEFPQADEILDE